MRIPLPPPTRRLAALAALALLITACREDEAPPTAPPGGAPPPAASVLLNGAKLNLAIAATRAAREKGLMGVTSLAADSGMLFVFGDVRQRAFWMKDTPIPLSIAFLDANKKIIYLADMDPFSLIQYGGLLAAPMQYAIEVNEGWFAEHGVTVGMVASFTLPSGLVIEPDP